MGASGMAIQAADMAGFLNPELSFGKPKLTVIGGGTLKTLHHSMPAVGTR